MYVQIIYMGFRGTSLVFNVLGTIGRPYLWLSHKQLPTDLTWFQNFNTTKTTHHEIINVLPENSKCLPLEVHQFLGHHHQTKCTSIDSVVLVLDVLVSPA
uniref:Uncharacterized protein n=1 Tax=Cacopsylla melanoneura TaxID=428564 RepID=A0A8D8U0E1_9HEMI